MRASPEQRDAKAVIEAMVAKLRDEYGAEAVILYGSRAKGSARPDSDVDLLIIKADAPQGFFQTFEEVNSVLSDIKGRLSLDARVYAPEQVERTLAIGDHFVQDIILKGQALHAGEGFAKYIELAEKSYSMNPQDSEYPEDWIRNAEEDYRMGLYLLEGNFPRGAGYSLQQAVEKFFKAYLIRQGWRLQRTHDLVELLDDALQYDSTLEKYRSVCGLVTKYSLAGRYPASHSEMSDLPVMSDENVRAALAEIEPLIERLRAGSARANIDTQDS
ncbi:MAG: HEPN domain-containing protein [Chloroflexota bacterium]|nr:HEPN domain-containing protein [Chloroflexota bacterium]